jgi:hypothetical protein
MHTFMSIRPVVLSPPVNQSCKSLGEPGINLPSNWWLPHACPVAATGDTNSLLPGAQRFRLPLAGRAGPDENTLCFLHLSPLACLPQQRSLFEPIELCFVMAFVSVVHESQCIVNTCSPSSVCPPFPYAWANLKAYVSVPALSLGSAR